MSNIRSYGPGNFATLIDAAVWSLSQEGCDEELAEEGFGFRGLLRTEGGTGLVDAIPFAEHPLNQDEIDFLSRQCGAILQETTDGHVSVDYYETPEELNGAWAGVQEDFADLIGEDEMDPGEQDAPTPGDDIPLP